MEQQEALQTVHAAARCMNNDTKVMVFTVNAAIDSITPKEMVGSPNTCANMATERTGAL